MTLSLDSLPKPTVVYITSRGHSGSTLLSLMLGGHPKVVSGGELKMLINPKSESKLQLSFLTPERCPF